MRFRKLIIFKTFLRYLKDSKRRIKRRQYNEGYWVPLEFCARIYNNEFYVPLDAILYEFGFKAEFDADKNIIKITNKE